MLAGDVRRATPDGRSVPETAVLAQLKKILASAGFFRAARMQRFLSYIVDVRLHSNASPELKESVIGVAVFDRDAAYDPKSDPVVRVEARRLRAKLDEYYEGPGQDDAVRLLLPKGSYAPVWFWQREPVLDVQAGRLPKRSLYAGAALLAVLLSALIATQKLWIRSSLPEPTQIRAVAVLPFRNLTGNASQDYIVSGITAELTTELANLDSLTVISSTSAEHYRGSAKTLPEIAPELHVDAIVEGTVLVSGDRVRVTAQLIRAATDTPLWAETYERDASDLFALQGEITDNIRQRIGATLNLDGSRGGHLASINREAHEAYLRGLYFWNKRTREDIEKSIACYRSAISSDPDYAVAYAALGESYVLLGSFTKAREAAEQALRLNTQLGQAHAVLAAIKAGEDWDWQGATREFQRAIELAPGYSTAHHWFSIHLSRLKRYEDAKREIRRALELDPLSLIIKTDAGETFYWAREPDDAMIHLRRALELDPNFAAAHMVLGKVYEQKHLYPKALAEFENADKLLGRPAGRSAYRAHALALLGREAEALKIARALEDTYTDRDVSGVDIGFIYCALGDPKSAVAWMENSYELREGSLDFLATEPLFDGCRGDPAFQQLVRKLRL